MKWLKDLRETVDVARGAKPPDLSRLSPEQRARYDENMARVAEAQDEAQASYEQGAAITGEAKAARILQGPAADYLYGVSDPGPSPEELERIRSEQGLRGMIVGGARAAEGPVQACARPDVRPRRPARGGGPGRARPHRRRRARGA